jgi:hypothetical protein
MLFHGLRARQGRAAKTPRLIAPPVSDSVAFVNKARK